MLLVVGVLFGGLGALADYLMQAFHSTVGAVAAAPVVLLALAWILSLPGTGIAMRGLIALLQLGCLAVLGWLIYLKGGWALIPGVFLIYMAMKPLHEWQLEVRRIRT